MNLITDNILFEKDFTQIQEPEFSNNFADYFVNSEPLNELSSKTAFEFISFESLKTLNNYGINLSFMIRNAAEWSSNKCYLNALQKAKNIQSTSIYTEQLVGQISNLNNSPLLKSKEKFNNLALCATEK